MSANRTSTQENILVLSLDFDGCIANDNYLISTDKNRAITTNKPLLDHIVKTIEAGHYSRIVLMIGSNRQSKELDDINANHARVVDYKKYFAGSCFPIFNELRNHIQTLTTIPCELDGYLLADTAGDKPAGENFMHASAGTPTELYHYSDTFFLDDATDTSYDLFDSNKVPLLYVQLHRNASSYPNAKIDFHFYDDIPNITGILKDFYVTHFPYFVPRNTTLKLHFYSGGTVTPRGELTGFGAIDHAYQHNIKQLVQLSQEKMTSAMVFDAHASKFALLTCRQLDFAEKHYYLSSILEKLKQSCEQSNDPTWPCITSLQKLADTLCSLKTEQISNSNDGAEKTLDQVIGVALSLHTYKDSATSDFSNKTFLIDNAARCKQLIKDFIAMVTEHRNMQQLATGSSTSLSFFKAPDTMQSVLNNQLTTFALTLAAYLELSIELEPKYQHS